MEKQEHLSHPLPQWAIWIGYAACLWAVLFAAAHLYWAGGGTFNMNAQEIGDGRKWFAQSPMTYLFSWGITITMFAIEGLFPLALVWKGNRVSKLYIQVITLLLAYAGMIVFALGSFFVTQQILLSLIALAICIVGVLVAFTRPGSQPGMLHWMILVATWVLAVGNLLNGLIYYNLALLAPFGLIGPPLIPSLPMVEVIWQGTITGSLFFSGGMLLLLTAIFINRHSSKNAS